MARGPRRFPSTSHSAYRQSSLHFKEPLTALLICTFSPIFSDTDNNKTFITLVLHQHLQTVWHIVVFLIFCYWKMQISEIQMISPHVQWSYESYNKWLWLFFWVRESVPKLHMCPKYRNFPWHPCMCCNHLIEEKTGDNSFFFLTPCRVGHLRLWRHAD